MAKIRATTPPAAVKGADPKTNRPADNSEASGDPVHPLPASGGGEEALMADTTIGHVDWYMPSPRSISVTKDAGLASLLRGTGAVYSGIWEGAVNEISSAADPASGASQSVLCPGAEVKAALQAIYNANTGNPAAPLLLAIISQI